MYGDFREVAEPENSSVVANLFVVITRHRKDLLASESACGAPEPSPCSDAEIPQGIEDVIGLIGGVETVEIVCSISSDASKRSMQ